MHFGLPLNHLDEKSNLIIIQMYFYPSDGRLIASDTES